MVDWWTEVGRATSAFLDQHGLLAAFVFLLIEEAGVPVPVPGDVLMLILGVHARQGFVPLWQAIAATWLGTLIWLVDFRQDALFLECSCIRITNVTRTEQPFSQTLFHWCAL